MGCNVNGFIGQLSVQAADFSILVIAVVTLLTVTRTTYMPAASRARKYAICLSVWVVPIVTATIATVLGSMGPVSGNWCWIVTTRPDLRYGLTHGWRIAIIISTIGIYGFVWWYMNRHFRSMVSTGGLTMETGIATARSWGSRRKGFRKIKGGQNRGDAAAAEGKGEEMTELSTVSKVRISRVVDEWEMSALEAAHVGNMDEEEAGGRTRQRGRKDSADSWSSADSVEGGEVTKPPPVSPHFRLFPTVAEPEPQPEPKPDHKSPGTRQETMMTAMTDSSEFPKRRQTRQREHEIKRMLLLNAYPIMYVLLWLPGLINRFIEASGHGGAGGRTLAALQASSQFVGLANAITYGFNTAMRTRLRRWWEGRKKRGHEADGG